MKGILAAFTRRARMPVPASPSLDLFAVLVARRAQRVCNRDRAAAEKYERCQTALRAEVKARA